MALVQIARIFDPTEAQVAAAGLRASGIATHLQNEHVAQANPLLQGAVGGFGLWVSQEDAADARAFLQLGRPAPPIDALEKPRRRRRWAAVLLGLIFGT